MALNFPAGPTVGQTYTSSGKTWKWDGTSWNSSLDVFKSAVVSVSDTIDCTASNYFTTTVSTNTTFSIINPPSAGTSYSFTLEVNHVSGTIGWPGSVVWPSSAAPSPTAGKIHLFIFSTDDGGSKWRGAAILDYAS